MFKEKYSGSLMTDPRRLRSLQDSRRKGGRLVTSRSGAVGVAGRERLEWEGRLG